MLIILIVLAVTIVVPIAIVVALVKGRPGIAAAVAAGTAMMVVGVAVLGVFFAIFIGRHSSTTTMHPPTSLHAPAPLPPTYTVNNQVQPSNGWTSSPPMTGINVPSIPAGELTWNIAFMPMLFILGGAVFLIATVARRAFAHAAGGGHRMIWPALIAVPIGAFFLLGSVRYHVSSNSNAQQAAIQAAQHTEIVQQQMVAEAQQATMAQRAAAMDAELQKRIAKMDIHELMDQFDAPRIVLQVTSAPTPATALLALAAATQQSATPEAAVTPEAPEPPQPPAPTAAPPQGTPRKSSKHKPSAKPAAQAAKATIAAQGNVKIEADSIATPNATAAIKPAWIGTPPKRTGNVRREVIETEEYATADECYQAADVYLLFKTFEHVQQMLNLPYQEGDLPSITFKNGSIFANSELIAVGRNSPHWTDTRPRYLDSLGIGIDFIRREIVAKDPDSHESCEYLETVERSVGPMKKVYMQMEFTPAIDRQIKERLDGLARKSRIGMVGLSAASVLILLGGVWGLLKVDTLTKGYYTKRLFLGVPLGILGLFGMYAALVEMGFDLPH